VIHPYYHTYKLVTLLPFQPFYLATRIASETVKTDPEKLSRRLQKGVVTLFLTHSCSDPKVMGMPARAKTLQPEVQLGLTCSRRHAKCFLDIADYYYNLA